jgi:hypothetical protein
MTFSSGHAPFVTGIALIMSAPRGVQGAALSSEPRQRRMAFRQGVADDQPSGSAPLHPNHAALSKAAGGDHTRLSSSVAPRVPRRSTSEQSVAPRPRIHEMDRRCAEALPRIAKRNLVTNLRNRVARTRSDAPARLLLFISHNVLYAV